MNFYTFKQLIMETLQKKLPEEYAGYKLESFAVMEKYEKREVLKLVPPSDAKEQVEAAIYLDDLYETLLTSFRKEAVEEKALQMLLGAMEYNKKADGSHIVMTVVETDKEQEMLRRCPHRSFHELSIVYRIYVNSEHQGFYSCYVTHGMADYIGLNEAALYELALHNTRKIYPPEIQSIGEHAYEMITTSSIGSDIGDNMPETVKEDSMYVVRNREGYTGAGYLVYPEVIEEIAGRAGRDFYLLPSSIYEMYIMVSGENGEVDYDALKAESNAEGLCEEEKLTSQIYYYNYGEKRMELFQFPAFI